MAERADTPPSVMTNDMFERHYERVFGSGSPIDGLVDPTGLKQARRNDIADTVALVRPKLTERFPELEAVDPLVVDELAVYISFFERGGCEAGIRIGHDETRRRARLDPNSPENVAARRAELGI
jgi:hypothetical protein